MLVMLFLAQTMPDFAYIETKDPITDKARIWIGIGSDEDVLSVGCDKDYGGGALIRIQTREHIGAWSFLNGTARLIYRFEGQEPVSGEWFKEGAGVHSDGRGTTVRFLQGMSKSRRVTFRITRYDGSQIDKTFVYPNPDQSIRKVLAACGDQKTEARVFAAK